jgi:methylated-DNA-[protein]-cysteine S-methyltransferase
MIHGETSYQIVRSALGNVGVVWHYAHRRAVVVHIMLPVPYLTQYIKKHYPHAQHSSTPSIDALCQTLAHYLSGARVRFPMSAIDTSRLYAFQKKILLCERKVPYGWVSTYGRIARITGNPGAARAVGTALARNPFPLIIPCHRTVRANGALGGFQGGVKLKRCLLELEGVQFRQSGAVVLNRVWPAQGEGFQRGLTSDPRVNSHWQ